MTVTWPVVILATAPVIAVLVWAVVDIVRRSDIDVAHKAIWMAVSLLIPLVGPLLYLIYRPRRSADLRGFGRRAPAEEQPGDDPRGR